MSITITPLLPFVIDRILLPEHFTSSARPPASSFKLPRHPLHARSSPCLSFSPFLLLTPYLSFLLPFSSGIPDFHSQSLLVYLQLRLPPTGLLRYARFSWQIARLPAPGHYARRACDSNYVNTGNRNLSGSKYVATTIRINAGQV